MSTRAYWCVYSAHRSTIRDLRGEMVSSGSVGLFAACIAGSEYFPHATYEQCPDPGHDQIGDFLIVPPAKPMPKPKKTRAKAPAKRRGKK